MFKLEFKTGNAAFEEDLEGQIAAILKDVAEKVQDRTSGKIMDINGNSIGEWEYN